MGDGEFEERRRLWADVLTVNGDTTPRLCCWTLPYLCLLCIGYKRTLSCGTIGDLCPSTLSGTTSSVDGGDMAEAGGGG